MQQQVTITDYDVTAGDDHRRVTEWAAGLPNAADLPPLSQLLMPPELASAFSISPEPHRSMIDVDRASRDTLSSLRGESQRHVLNKVVVDDFRSGSDGVDEEVVVEGEETVDLTRNGSVSRRLRRDGSGGDGVAGGGAVEDDDCSGRTSKRIRLVWTPQLHKRFVEVVAHLGVKNAVPKTIMQLMNVEGLTRENVASHLQKYRLYLKRMQGLSNEGASPSDQDHLFASTPVPNSLRDCGGGSGNEKRHAAVPLPMPYAPAPHLVPVPYPPPPQIVPSGGGGGSGYHHGFEYHMHPYSMMMQPKDWSGNNLGSVSQYQQHVNPNHK